MGERRGGRGGFGSEQLRSSEVRESTTTMGKATNGGFQSHPGHKWWFTVSPGKDTQPAFPKAVRQRIYYIGSWLPGAHLSIIHMILWLINTTMCSDSSPLDPGFPSVGAAVFGTFTFCSGKKCTLVFLSGKLDIGWYR